jgi:hypothetical protein
MTRGAFMWNNLTVRSHSDEPKTHKEKREREGSERGRKREYKEREDQDKSQTERESGRVGIEPHLQSRPLPART